MKLFHKNMKTKNARSATFYQADIYRKLNKCLHGSSQIVGRVPDNGLALFRFFPDDYNIASIACTYVRAFTRTVRMCKTGIRKAKM